jgi:hypothetical protein
MESAKKSLYTSILPKYIKSAPYDISYDYFTTSLDAAKELRSKGGLYCAQFLYPEIYKPSSDLYDLIPKPLLERDAEGLADIISAVGKGNTPPPLSQEAKTDFKQSLVNLEKKSPWALAAIIDPDKASSRPDLMCDARIMLFTEILYKLPKSRAAAVIRYILSSPY